VPKRERRHSCCRLNTFGVVESDIAVNERPGKSEGRQFVSVDAFGFEDGEETLSHSVIIAIIAYLLIPYSRFMAR